MSLDVSYIEYVTCDKCGHQSTQVAWEYWKNITHNLGRMALEAGFYNELWRPEENGIKTLGEITKAVERGLYRMKNEPELFKTFSAKNGWGTYEQFIPWLEEFIEDTKEHPNALINYISR